MGCSIYFHSADGSINCEPGHRGSGIDKPAYGLTEEIVLAMEAYPEGCTCDNGHEPGEHVPGLALAFRSGGQRGPSPSEIEQAFADAGWLGPDGRWRSHR